MVQTYLLSHMCDGFGCVLGHNFNAVACFFEQFDTFLVQYFVSVVGDYVVTVHSLSYRT